jgi:hypothetical protein
VDFNNQINFIMNLKEKLKDNKKIIRMVSDDLGVLQRGGFDMVCPIVPPVQVKQRVQNPLMGGAIQEQIQIQKNSCNTNCPLMEIASDFVVLHCGGNPIRHEIKKVIDLGDNDNDDVKIIGIGQGGTA